MGFLETHIPNKPFIRKVIDRIKERRLHRYYDSQKKPAKNKDRMIIFMADGRMHHGGLTDRLCGLVSAYNYSKKHGYSFRAYFVTPYVLSDILLPAIYDWRICADDISYNKYSSRPLYISFIPDYTETEKYFKSKIEEENCKQIHLYTNARYFKHEEFPGLFSELFKPNAQLQEIIDYHKRTIGDEYVSCTFRFQQLLGDFKEEGFPELSTLSEKEELVQQCLSRIEDLRNNTQKRILVTSDSKTFLKCASEKKYVYTIPGDIRHMDYSRDKTDIKVDMKSWVDFLMVANASEIYLCIMTPLYKSGFALAASHVHNRPYKEID